jgi:rubredoxin
MRQKNAPGQDKEPVVKKYMCGDCDYVYDPAVGDPAHGIAPGTAFEDIPDDWECPECNAMKDDFFPLEDDA